VGQLVEACSPYLEGGKGLELGLFLARRGEQLYLEPAQRLASLQFSPEDKVSP
jgi:hypothetical protein